MTIGVIEPMGLKIGQGFISNSGYRLKPDYEIDLKDFIASRGWEGVTAEDLLVYVVINIFKGEKGKRITANLMGPIIINSKNNEDIQVVISDSTYSHQHNVLESS